MKLKGLFTDLPIKTICIYCGTFGHVVEVDTVLDAASKLLNRQDIGFVFIGSGQRLEEYKKTSAERGLNAFFLGRKSKQEVHAICNAADICIYSAKDGELSAAMLGNKVFDYLGANKPIVYSGPKGAVSDVIEELKAGLLSSAHDAIGLAGNIEKLADSPSLYKRIKDGAKSFKTAGYTANNAANILSGVIKQHIT